jgi:hypothetical protein
MDAKNKLDKKDLSYIIGGAIIGAIAGYIISRVGIKNLMNMLKKKEIIPSSISSLLKDFTSDKESEE